MPAGRPAKHQRSPFGERLVIARQQAGLSQTQVADKLGITQPSYADWERRAVALKPEYLPKLAALFNVSVDFLLGNEARKQRGSGPAGRVRRVFEAVSRLPRKQQQKVVEMAEGFLALQANKSNGH
jgi:transcriptional regulator with XRE-family HTH domain